MSTYSADHASKTEPLNGRHTTSTAKEDSLRRHATSSVLDLLGADDPLRQEMEALLSTSAHADAAKNGVAANQDQPEAAIATATALDPDAASAAGELERLREENLRLQARVEELEQLLEATSDQTEQVWSEQQKEYEALLEEKSEVIRSLHQQLLQARNENSASENEPESEPKPEHASEDSQALGHELLALKEQLDAERRQLDEDEEALMEQARQMELAMSRERVELARQRNELQQMYRQLQHEIEQASRDGALRERLAGLQRRQQEIAPNGAAATNGRPGPRQALPTQQAIRHPSADQPEKQTGIFRRFFG